MNHWYQFQKLNKKECLITSLSKSQRFGHYSMHPFHAIFSALCNLDGCQNGSLNAVKSGWRRLALPKRVPRLEIEY